jgi:FixJ family two-component response regulator
VILAVIDDDRDVRTAIGRCLRSYGYDVRTFDSAESYLADIAAFDCAIVDIGLPGLSGVELAGRMARSDHAVPVVYITAHNDLARHRESAGNRVVRKPIDEHLLLHAIVEATGRSG